MTTRRDTLKCLTLLAVTEKVTDGGFAPVSAPLAARRNRRVLPPGAAENFSAKCVGCGLCVAACPEKVIRLSNSLRHFGKPELDFTEGNCLLGCVRCSQVCPAGAIEPLQREMRPQVQIGIATWRKDRCLRVTEKEECHACERKCPVQAISLKTGVPVVNAKLCIGCGACEHVCPARPETAIHVDGFESSRRSELSSEQTMIDQLKDRLQAGASLVVAKDGVVVAEDRGRGIAPLVKFYEAGKLRGAMVADKVVGKAAEGAVELCRRQGVKLVADRVVPTIRNREHNGDCPMEVAVRDSDDPQTMLSNIKTTLERINAK